MQQSNSVMKQLANSTKYLVHTKFRSSRSKFRSGSGVHTWLRVYTHSNMHTCTHTAVHVHIYMYACTCSTLEYTAVYTAAAVVAYPGTRVVAPARSSSGRHASVTIDEA
jgi:hypothetical protein